MKNIKKVLFSILAGVLFLAGTNVDAKEVAWNDLVEKLKDGSYAEGIRNAQNNGENISIDFQSDSSKFVAKIVDLDSNDEYKFELTYENGVVKFVNNLNITNSDEELSILADTIWISDVIMAAGDLYGYSEEDVVNFIQYGNGNDSYTLDSDGIEFTLRQYSYTGDDGEPVSGEQIAEFKLDLVNGFGGLEECPDRVDSEQPSVSEPGSSEVVPQPAPEIPEEQPQEEIENPSTGDIQVYKVVGGIAVCMMLAIGAAIHLRKKEEII